MKITKKLMMAAGLFFQLSGGLQAMTNEMQQAIDAFGGKDAVIAAKNKMNPGEAKKIALNQGKGTPEAQAVAYYVSSNVGGGTLQKGMFPDKDKANTTVTAALGLDKPAAAPAQEAGRQEAPAQEEASQDKRTHQDCSALQNQLDAAKAQLATVQAESDKKPSQSQLVEAQQATTAANSAKAAAEKDAAAAKAQLAALQEKMSAGDTDLAALIAAAKDKKGAEKYVPLATKAAESLKAAVDAIEDADAKAKVTDAIKAVFGAQAPAEKSSKQSQNMGRLGSKSKKKQRA